MGAFLDKPKTEKIVEKGEGNGIRYGVSAMQGWRMEMEDAHVCKTSLSFDQSSSFFGVFDGHAGPKVAQHCSINLLKTIDECYGEEENSEERIKKAIHKGFIKLDETMRERIPWSNNEDRSGTTAVVAMITPEHIYLGNCGDSRAILCRNGCVEFATTDHKPFNETERTRIEKAGGTVMMARVNGSLAVSRALGDYDYKRSTDLPSICQLVSPEPEIDKIDRKLKDDHFLLLACDGIFDVMNNEEVVQYVTRQLHLTDDLEKICSSLIDRCLNKNSRDNMSVILVVFPAAPKVSLEEIEKEEVRTKEAIALIETKLKLVEEEAQDPIDLQEDHVMSILQKVEALKDFDVFTRRDEIVETLTTMRKNKFKDTDFPGFSDPSDAPRDFDGTEYAPSPRDLTGLQMMVTGQESREKEVSSTTLEPIVGEPVLPSTAADSDTARMDGISSSTTNKTIM